MKNRHFQVLGICAVLAPQAFAQTLPNPPAAAAPVAQYEYDAMGRPTKVTVAPGVAGMAFVTSHAYGPLGQRVSTTDAKSGLIQFGYDKLLQRSSVKDPRSLTTQYTVNGLGLMSGLASPDTGTAAFTYDAGGRLGSITDARGVLASYGYDELSRPTSLSFSKEGSASRQITWTYDENAASFGYAVGRLTTAATPDATTSYSYDAQGRQATVTQRVSGRSAQVVSYEYDGAGHVTSITYPTGRVVHLTYENGMPRVVSLSASSGAAAQTLIDQVTYAPFGPVKSWVWGFSGQGQSYARVFDTNGRLIRYPLGMLIRDIGYDSADRITSYTHYDATTGVSAPSYNQSFTYDALGRLTSASANGTSWSMAYDANGNRTSVTMGSSTRLYTTAATSNRLTALTNPQRNFSYDSAGNTVSDTGTSGYQATYNLEGRLASMTSSGMSVEYLYDAEGRRVAAAASQQAQPGIKSWRTFVYDLAGHVLGEYSDDGQVATEYVWLDDVPIAVFRSSMASPTVDPTIAYLYADHLGAPRVAVDQVGQIRWRWISEPFGVAAAESQPTAGLDPLEINLRFPGQQFDRFVGLNYNYFRDYDPTVGRYVQSDPIGLGGGINTYAYVEGNPLSGVDPTGLKKWDWNGTGNTAVCKYYDSMATQHPKCSYYKVAADICRGNNSLVNSAVNTAITNSWARDKTQDSQATILEKVRQALVAADKKAREDGKVDCNTDCVYGNDIDQYHDAAFIAAGLSPRFYGGNLWPQGMPPNPVPRDPRNPIRPPGYSFGP